MWTALNQRGEKRNLQKLNLNPNHGVQALPKSFREALSGEDLKVSQCIWATSVASINRAGRSKFYSFDCRKCGETLLRCGAHLQVQNLQNEQVHSQPREPPST